METSNVAIALTYLHAADPVLSQLITRCGPYTLQPDNAQPFLTLCRAIVAQQLSGKAADSIMARLQALHPALTPMAVLDTPADELRHLGLSRQKAASLYDFASKVQTGLLPLEQLATASDAEVMQQLTQVRGIGPWTAEMYLIFALGRPDVFPVRDLGIRKAIQAAYGYKRLPALTTMQRHARKWVPYRTMATWYLWRSLDNR